jgi:hypothetical protein
MNCLPSRDTTEKRTCHRWSTSKSRPGPEDMYLRRVWTRSRSSVTIYGTQSSVRSLCVRVNDFVDTTTGPPSKSTKSQLDYLSAASDLTDGARAVVRASAIPQDFSPHPWLLNHRGEVYLLIPAERRGRTPLGAPRHRRHSTSKKIALHSLVGHTYPITLRRSIRNG